MNCTDLQQVDPLTRRAIGHTRQRQEVDWLQTDRATQLRTASNPGFGLCFLVSGL